MRASLYASAFTFLGVYACADTLSESAKARYAAEQTACVEVYATAEAITDCREKVRKAWGKPPRDGGAE